MFSLILEAQNLKDFFRDLKICKDVILCKSEIGYLRNETLVKALKKIPSKKIAGEATVFFGLYILNSQRKMSTSNKDAHSDKLYKLEIRPEYNIIY